MAMKTCQAIFAECIYCTLIDRMPMMLNLRGIGTKKSKWRIMTKVQTATVTKWHWCRVFVKCRITDDDSIPELMGDEDVATLQEKLAIAEELQKQSKLPLGAVEILTPKD